MRAVVQRVTEARVTVDGEVVGEIGPGLCALVGVTHDDGVDQARKLATKLWGLRILDGGVMNQSVSGGRRDLVVSQFTLYAPRRGRRPSWIRPAPSTPSRSWTPWSRSYVGSGLRSRPGASAPTCASPSSTTGRSP